jgi:hypothetical protein
MTGSESVSSAHAGANGVIAASPRPRSAARRVIKRDDMHAPPNRSVV